MKVSTITSNMRQHGADCRAANYKETVERLWTEGRDEPRNLHTTWSKLNGMAKSLAAWSRESFGAPKIEIRKLEKRLSWLRIHSATGTYCQEEKEIERKLCELFERKEIMARQVLEWTSYKLEIVTHPFFRRELQQEDE